MVWRCHIEVPRMARVVELDCLSLLVKRMMMLESPPLPRGLFDLWISKTISIVCVIWSPQSVDPAEQIGFTSIDMLCHDASNSLCPSSKLEIPALPLHGSNLRKGVKFSVHTTSLGSVPCRRCRFERVALEWSPAG